MALTRPSRGDQAWFYGAIGFFVLLAIAALVAVVASPIGWPIVIALVIVVGAGWVGYDIGKRDGHWKGYTDAGKEIAAMWETWEQAHPEDFAPDEDGIPTRPFIRLV